MTDAARTPEAGCHTGSNGELSDPTPSLLNMDPQASDGSVHATALCRVNRKPWNDDRRTDRATTDLEALSAERGFPVSTLCLSLKGGARQGTWVHPQVGVDLARWISAAFAVRMDGWFLESVLQAAPAPVGTPPPRLRQAEAITLVEQSIGLLERLGRAAWISTIRSWSQTFVPSNVLTAGSGQALLPVCGDGEAWTLGDTWLKVFQRVLPRSRSCSAGEVVAMAYRKEFAQDPPCRQLHVDGAPRQERSSWRSWLLDRLQMLLSQQGGS